MAEAKVMLRVDHDADNILIAQLIAAATNEAQRQAARSFVTQTLSLRSIDGRATALSGVVSASPVSDQREIRR